MATAAVVSGCLKHDGDSDSQTPILTTCDPELVAPVELSVGATPFPHEALAEDRLRSDITSQGLEYPDLYSPRLDATLERHRVGDILIHAGYALRELSQAGDYQAQLAVMMSDVSDAVDAVIAAGGRVQLKIHCSTPQWMATHAYPHNVLTGEDVPSGEPTWACSAPNDLAEWRAIMRAVGELFAARADHVSVSIGSEPESYFAGTREELFDWYTASIQGLLDSSNGSAYRVGGLTFVGHQHHSLGRATPVLQGDTLIFTEAEYDTSLTQSWIEHSAGAGLPLHLVSLHQFGGSAVPTVGTRWRRARHDISEWLEQNGYAPEEVEVLIEDWPQWAPYTSNDTEYLAAHVASGIVSMLNLSLVEGAPIKPYQGFLFDFGFRPSGDYPAGFTGRAGLSNEMGIIKPVFNLNSLLAEVEGSLHPVETSDPFVHAVAGVGEGHTTILVTNQIPLEYQIESLYNFWEQRPIFENDFVEEDLSSFDYDPLEPIQVFFDGVMPGWPALIDAFLEEPSSIDLDQLSWPSEIKNQWEEMRRFGRLARERRYCIRRVEVALPALENGTYRLEHYILDSRHANPYPDRDDLDRRLSGLRGDALAREAMAINGEYDAESGKQPDRDVEIADAGGPFELAMEPNSVHLLRFSRVP